MPTEILVQVLEKLDSMEQLICQKVCQSLRTAVNNLEINCDSISFEVWYGEVAMYLDSLKILYNDAANGTSIVTYNNKETIIKGEHYLQIAFNDLGTLLKRVKTFSFEIYRGGKHVIVTCLLNLLNANQCVHVKKIVIRFLPLNDICSILPYFDSQMLESIELYCDGTTDNFEHLAQLEQWKNSKECRIRGSLGDNIPIQHLLHFKNISVTMNENALQKMIEIRDKLLIRSTFEGCLLWLKKTNFIEIARVFQPHYSGSEEFEIEYLRNNVKYKISCDKKDGSIRLFYIRRCEM